MATAVLHPAAPAARSALYDYLTTTDHKKIGVLYLVNSMLFFVLGGILALVVRVELAAPGIQFVPNEDFYNQAFTMHASFMLFLFVIPILAGFGNYAVPLQIGAPDMAFPRINALSLWLLPLGGLLMASGFFVSGGAAAAGWTEYPPLTSSAYSGTGTDLWIVGLTLIGTSSILGAVNFLVTIFKMRAPGMTLFRMPILVWTVLVTSVLVLMATPVLTSALIMLFIDRNYGGAFFDPANGGQAVLYQNVFWFYSHPAVYIMILPAMGIVSEVLPVFSRKPLFGYKAFVFATVGIGALGFSVWAHHMFTTGAVFLPFFSLMTFLIAVPTGVKMFNWMATMWRGQLELKTPLLFAVEAREREERGPEHARGERDALAAELQVVVCLHEQEDDAEEDGHCDVADEPAAVVLLDRPYRELTGEGADHEEDRGRQHDREDVQLECLLGLRVDRRPGRGVGADVEVGGEQAREEHHLGGDEQQHPEDRVADAAGLVARGGLGPAGRQRVCVGRHVGVPAQWPAVRPCRTSKTGRSERISGRWSKL